MSVATLGISLNVGKTAEAESHSADVVRRRTSDISDERRERLEQSLLSEAQELADRYAADPQIYAHFRRSGWLEQDGLISTSVFEEIREILYG